MMTIESPGAFWKDYELIDPATLKNWKDSARSLWPAQSQRHYGTSLCRTESGTR